MLKSFVLALLLASAAVPALAQSTPASPATAGQYQYCSLVGVGPYGRNPVLDYGQHAKPAATDADLDNLSAQLQKMDSAMLALAYLCNHGWEYLGVSSLSHMYPGFTVYLMRRRLP